MRLRRRGLVVALSGGIDSSVCTALAARALGPSRVFALFLPETDSSPASSRRAREVASRLGVELLTQDITATLEALGSYRERDEAIRAVLPGYGPGWRSKLVRSTAGRRPFRFFRLVAQAPDGSMHERRLPHRAYQQVVAAQNYKQRVRKTVEYFHADRLNYAVLGTPNRLEYEQGFFVRSGDGASDIAPIAHLYKTQVFALGRHLGLPDEVCRATPTSDTYSLPQDQAEFYFGLPYEQMDVALWAHNQGWSPQELGSALAIDQAAARALLEDVEAKKRLAQELHAPAHLVEPLGEI